MSILLETFSSRTYCDEGSRMRLQTAVFSCVIFAVGRQVMAEWQVPANPDPRAILTEARADARAGRFEDALAKHVWFHDHALEHRESLYGVRLSFALSDWSELGEQYPPARKKLIETRDKAEKQVGEEKKDIHRPFHEMAAINEYLGDQAKTVEAFVQLDTRTPIFARAVYRIAEPALVKAKEFKLCGKYLEPEISVKTILMHYRYNLQAAEENDSRVPKELRRRYAEDSFTNDSGTLVALLVLNDRKSEAEKIAEQVKRESENAERNKIIDAALEGTIPEDDDSD